MILIDTPAQVQYAPRIENSVSVRGGSNYDLSRGGVATPVVLLPEPAPAVVAVPVIIEPPPSPRTTYEPKYKLPAGEPVARIAFDKSSTSVPEEDRRHLLDLKPGTRVAVIGHASSDEKGANSLAQRRAKAAVRALPAGVKVQRAVSFGAKLPLDHPGGTALEANRRVEIFIVN